ncbi:hypothetical protein X975_26660, partial [Stegodyphus mimosarum]
MSGGNTLSIGTASFAFTRVYAVFYTISCKRTNSAVRAVTITVAVVSLTSSVRITR